MADDAGLPSVHCCTSFSLPLPPLPTLPPDMALGGCRALPASCRALPHPCRSLQTHTSTVSSDRQCDLSSMTVVLPLTHTATHM